MKINVQFRSGYLSKHNTEYKNLIDKQSQAIEYCYLRTSLNKVSGTLKYQITLDKNGKIIEVKVLENSYKNGYIENCIKKKIEKLSLTSPDNSKKVTFTLEIEFS